MYEEYKKRAVRILRTEGKSLTDIQALFLDIPKSTLWYWCKGVQLSSEVAALRKQKNKDALMQMRARAHILRKKRIQEFEASIVKKHSALSRLYTNNREYALYTLALLYLCEGSKAHHYSITFGNSDPEVIQLFLFVLRTAFTLDEKKFRCTIQCRADQNVLTLERFWSSLTQIPLAQFYASRIDPRSVGKRSRNTQYKGVCRIDYFSASLFKEIMLLIRELKKVPSGPVV